MRRFTLALLFLGVLGVLSMPESSAKPAKQPSTEYTYRQDGDRITVSYICDDGTIVPGPHPSATIDFGGSKVRMSLSAHGVDDLNGALQTYGGGHTLTPEAVDFLNALLPTVTCPPTE